MLYQGSALSVTTDGDGIATLTFDREGESVNTLSSRVIGELQDAVGAIEAAPNLTGLILASAKSAFIVGADITEFHGLFAKGEDYLVEMNQTVHALFNRLEDLPFPTVSAINGLALGGGFEVTLTTDFRVMAERAEVGLPETRLGILPGWGGCVRLPRLVGADNAIEWIAGGTQNKAAEALRIGAVDAVLPAEELLEAARDILQRANRGELDHKARRAMKTGPLGLNGVEQMMAFETAKGYVAGKAGRHYPAPVEAVKVVQKGAGESRERAQAIEAKAFAKLALTDVCYNLVGLFLNDQQVKKKAGAYEKQAPELNHTAVLGAGIMGGGIAYQSASKGVPILMRDIREEAIQLGLKEARKLFVKQVERGKLNTATMAERLTGIRPTLSYGDFGTVDLVVEAVVENPDVKTAVLSEVEAAVGEDTILASNTSTISISRLAKALKRPEKFCGMHFFNPVHRMPLVEVIRGEHTGDEAVAATVAYARRMGKTPIVVNDCPGFLVNRVLFPYFGGFERLLKQGADYEHVDKVMEGFGWPMGPAYLLDVVGLDTARHAADVLAEGFPDRMGQQGESIVARLVDDGRLGQKNSRGFYRYEEDRKGKPRKVRDDEARARVAESAQTTRELDDETVIAHLMVPLCLETVRCLEDGIVGTPAEADTALIYGIGFPPFRGGALRYIDVMGLEAFVVLADRLAEEHGALYRPTERLREMAANGERFYPAAGESAAR